MIETILKQLQIALNNQDGLSISILITRIELLGYKLQIKGDKLHVYNTPTQ